MHLASRKGNNMGKKSVGFDRALTLKWVEALESGTRKQCKSTLKRKGRKNRKARYCCLGVACAVAGVKSNLFELHGLLIEPGNPPELADVAKRIGVTEGRQDALTSMNDAGNNSFKEIAAWIRRNILKEKGKTK